ncbi:hypothetical protein TREMEDRAFT_73467 [Tremella mesenterica DSM 1558]|uniref:uncharacterized protein n=1 Tax=Tremella mesenterica (strain ATCC 24925 / CBS 8224 / DSM 1558 / NBRC 9311 / NRRL Y-6157 / RJB 2259-6 / UBC 559-6) TaxID=578456 RepID=UPI0003F49DBB|nr:uncharacterized protein TREMEDRAFT_73467 [Tremella mesenterica DSM 1558]EIW70440.1 hypothetical protein TREMEDRAFT_73467 [Tremella mesenterica DSM 1558]
MYSKTAKTEPARLPVFITAVVIRLALFQSTLISSALQHRPELVSPQTSFRSLLEGVYLRRLGYDPYDGGTFVHPPDYLGFFSLFGRHLPVIAPYVWILLDIVGALALVEIWTTRLGHHSLSKGRESLVAALYLFNPYTIATCVALTTTSVDNSLLLLTIALAAQKRAIPASLLFALSSRTAAYPICLLPALAMLVTPSCKGASVGRSAAILLVACGGSFLSSTSLSQSGMLCYWKSIVGLPFLTPNVGMWWYFFTEMFDHFRHFFLGVFQFHCVIYVIPVCIRLRHDPLLAMAILLSIFATWKSYPTLGDMNVPAGLLACFPEVLTELKHPLFSLTVYAYTFILLPLLHSLWLVRGTGNANFFYAATMVHGLNSSLAIVDVLGASIRTGAKARLVLPAVDLEDDKPDSRKGEMQLVQLLSAVDP